MIEKHLENMGLTPKESHFYVELLQLGTQSASTLARRLNYPRSTVQFIADSLVKKGFASKSVRQKITHYTVEQPENLLTILEHQKDRYLDNLEIQKKQIANILPLLQDLSKKHAYSKPQVNFYEGIDGLEQAYLDVLTSKEEIRTLVSYTEAHLKKSDKVSIFQRRANKGIPARCIMRDSAMAQKRTSKNKEELRESIIIDANKYKWVPEIQIYDNKVNIVSLDENIGVIIESEQIAQAMKVLYDLAWIGAKKEKNANNLGDPQFTSLFPYS